MTDLAFQASIGATLINEQPVNSATAIDSFAIDSVSVSATNQSANRVLTGSEAERREPVSCRKDEVMRKMKGLSDEINR